MKIQSFTNPVFILLLPLFILLNYFSSFFPYAVESVFSIGFNKPIIKFLSTLTGLFPISLAEIFFLGTAIFVFFYLILFLYSIFKSKNKIKLLYSGFLKITIICTLIYSLFLLIWGFNYQRLPFSTIAHLNTKPASLNELVSLCETLIDRTNNLRNFVSEDINGVMVIQDGVDGVLFRAEKGYSNISKRIPKLGGKFGNPKPIFFSRALSYTGIAGIYFPFTAEANVNTAIPFSMLPNTTCHEMAHQRGFAREDEANYIAYLTSTAHPDKDFQYSGSLLALIHSMNALYRYDQEKYMELQDSYSDGLKRDLSHIHNFWNQFEGPVERTTTKINNAYLKSNLQEDGVYSYGRMVDLLLAEHRKKTQ